MIVTDPQKMNPTFALAYNSRNLQSLLALYEPNAILRTDGDGGNLAGMSEIAEALSGLLAIPGTMTSRNHFCIEHDGLALLRADWVIVSDEGAAVASGSSAELIRRQADGNWRYVIDHAVGASLPRLE